MPGQSMSVLPPGVGINEAIYIYMYVCRTTSLLVLCHVIYVEQVSSDETENPWYKNAGNSTLLSAHQRPVSNPLRGTRPNTHTQMYQRVALFFYVRRRKAFISSRSSFLHKSKPSLSHFQSNTI